ncbi:hypothetical protein SJAV_25790 [Sulfurisphaera javensis]|uniref:Uncharacterized protein n=1 Tax=Sulfurisphaera javensis TaxID=2049879 RepID=A0AAT9GUZ2_9CREN
MSSLLDIVLEILALQKVIKEEIQKPMRRELLSIIYEIKPIQNEIKLDDLLKEYNAKDLVDLVQKITLSMKSDKNGKT